MVPVEWHSEKDTIIGTENRSIFARSRSGCRGWLEREKLAISWSDGTVLYLDYSGGYETVWLCQNSKNYKQKEKNCIICRFQSEYILQYSTFKRKDILILATAWMNLEGFTLTERSQTQKDKYWTVLLIRGT